MISPYLFEFPLVAECTGNSSNDGRASIPAKLIENGWNELEGHILSGVRGGVVVAGWGAGWGAGWWWRGEGRGGGGGVRGGVVVAGWGAGWWWRGEGRGGGGGVRGGVEVPRKFQVLGYFLNR